MKYRYYSLRTIAKARIPKYSLGISGQYNAVNEFDYDSVRSLELPVTRLTVGNSDKKNELGFGSGVRLSRKLAWYNDIHNVDLIPEDQLSSIDLNSLIQSMTYEQALGFYNWKYPIDKFTPKSNWQDFVYPSEEQFSAIQKGESIVIPEHEVEFPTPLFRYAVHVFPKN